MFFEVKIDAETKQYKIGTEVKCDTPETMSHKRTASGSIKLTLTNDVLGNNFGLSFI